MEKNENFKKGYNRNLMGGKRPHKGIGKYGYMTLTERLVAETEALDSYHKRVGQGRWKDKVKKTKKCR